MVISLTPGNNTSPTVTLPHSGVTLTPQPLTDAQKEALKNAAANTPAVVYHPSTEVPATTEPMEAVDTWIGRSQSSEFPKMVAQHSSSTESLKTSYQAFKSTLASVYPDLASKKFGFTIEANGNLKATNSAGELNKADTEQLNTLLNASSGLKAAAATYRETAIDLVDADSPWSGSYLGRYNLTKENFADSLDLGALFIPKTSTPSKEQSDGMFFNQLAYKGVLHTQETEAAMLAKRAAEKAATAG
ncbi:MULTISPECIES: hypothetical protein [Pseudomonas syringae group]|uniref:Uncharacterized protein n=7 Tax=Pseudomonas syringae group TaxID=136849 RepID=A0AAD0GT02_9PSED|nr:MULTISPECIES: hypothetical protein [Pseudomonas syringae group]AVB22732.1 hypothetical protein BKM03_28555 [Pseudomonas avellanae]EGH08485.1 hypothetical protein PSYMP_06803 [Pseudomonas amygdali pv. morsprunorum str. M302280]EPM50493.1 hypothetical protein A246_05322 [Pseudomonas syringae pv. actinidiae ICMP 19098]EPN14422.1 hypothetical protein A249_08305 [Pseudomonas syringae pv. actinidiae ICMP 18804]EPN20666.1 hypothetical protein A248_05705 [Pseudomonas syringae pv. actinidiae ICMP 19